MLSTLLKIYPVAFIVFFLIDIFWLGFVAPGFYREHIGFLLKDNPNWYAAAIFYITYIFGLSFFVLLPALEKQSFSQAILLGALFGFVTYATYDLTNHATVKNWPIIVTIVDLAWGTILCATVSAVSYYLIQYLGIKM